MDVADCRGVLSRFQLIGLSGVYFVDWEIGTCKDGIFLGGWDHGGVSGGRDRERGQASLKKGIEHAGRRVRGMHGGYLD